MNLVVLEYCRSLDQLMPVDLNLAYVVPPEVQGRIRTHELDFDAAGEPFAFGED